VEKYIGIDVHSQSCTLAVMGAAGKRLKSQVVDTNGKVLVDAVLGIAGRRHICMEEGTQSAWLYEVLRPHAEEVVVTLADKHKGPKDDLRDAWKLAEQLRTGSLRTRVYKAVPRQFSGLRDAVRAYNVLTRDEVRLKNRLRAIYRSRGVAVTAAIYDADSRQAWLKKLPPSHRQLAELLGKQLDALLPLQQEAEIWLKKEAKAHPIMRTLSTAPGMGVIRTAQVVAIGVTPHRFRTKRQFWSYCGLGIVTRSSSDWVRDKGQWVRAQTYQTRGLNRNRNPLLKSVFKGAATTVLQQLREHPLCADYHRLLASGTKPNLAKLTLARRIAAAVLAMWKNEEVYDSQKTRNDNKT
jgi:transposase